jgi:hypothetical protein
MAFPRNRPSRRSIAVVAVDLALRWPYWLRLPCWRRYRSSTRWMASVSSRVRRRARWATPRPLISTRSRSTALRAGWRGERAARILADLQFDQAPVFSGSRLIGYVLRNSLEEHPQRTVRSATTSVDQTSVLSASADLNAFLGVLDNRRFAFVVGQTGIEGFVTPSDLNKHAARAHFYLLLAELEILLSNAIRARVRNQDNLLEFLGRAVQRTIRRRFQEDSAAAIEVDFLVYMGATRGRTWLLRGHASQTGARQIATQRPDQTRAWSKDPGLDRLLLCHPRCTSRPSY